jgi:pentatricopeptide repeat protein
MLFHCYFPFSPIGIKGNYTKYFYFQHLDQLLLPNVSNQFCIFYIWKNFKLGFHPNIVTLTMLIKGLCLKGEIHKAIHFHDQVVALGFHLNQVSYGTLINGMYKMGETKAAMDELMEN